MPRTASRIRAIVLTVSAASSSVSAQQVDLYIGYRLPTNPDLAANARLIEASARRQRAASTAICESRKGGHACERDAEITFRGHLLAAADLAYGLYVADANEMRWVINLPARLATSGSWDQFYERLEPDLAHPLGIRIDLRSCQFIRAQDGQPMTSGDALFSQTVCRMIANGQNATDMLGTLWRPKQPPSLEQVRMLLDLGANPGPSRGGFRDSPGSKVLLPPILAQAVSVAEARVIRLLVERGADVNAYDDSWGAITGLTALGEASRLGRSDIVRLLLDAGANVHKVDAFKMRALDYAAKAGEYNTAKLLLGAGANPNQTTRNATAPLSYAALIGEIGLVRLLLDAGADVNASPDGETALSYAIRANRSDVARLLRERGAK